MAKANSAQEYAAEFTKAFESMFENFPKLPTDMSALTDSTKEVAEFNAKLNTIALEAAKKNAELSAKWTQDVISEISGLNKPQDQIADYAEAVSESATKHAQATPERIGEFAEVDKKAQVEAVELIMAATKDMKAKVLKA